MLTAERTIEFPGVVLEPGVYVVMLCETGEKRSTVQILNQTQTQVLGTVVAVPDHHVRPDDNSEFTYYETLKPGPVPVQSWFYMGDLVGLEFVYPAPRAKDIAKDMNTHVLAFNIGSDAVILAITPNGKQVLIDGEPVQTARRKPQ